MDRLRSVKLPTITLLAIGCLVLFVLVGVNLVMGVRTQSALDTVTEMREVRRNAVELQAALQSAESSQRGYLLTGNDIYLAPFATAVEEAGRRIADLRANPGLNARKADALTRLEQVTTEKIDELTQTIELFRKDNRMEGVDLLSKHHGKALMDEAMVFISAIIRNAEQEVSSGIAVQHQSLNTLQNSTYLAVLVVVLVSFGVFFVQRSFVRDLHAANTEVLSLNQQLEVRVEQRTRELEHARDRAEMLLAEVNHRVANSLTMVASLVGMQARASGNDETKRILADTQARINAVGVVHKQLYTGTNVQSVALQDFLPNLLAQIEGSLRSEGLSASLRKDIEPMELSTDKTVSLGIIVTEWVTNAFKYAYPDSKGEIRVRLVKRDDGLAQVSVEDDGVGLEAGTGIKGTGLGTKLVSAMASSLGGKIEYLDRNPGTEARLIMPV